ncbi:MAG: 30S ribosomal protein S27e [Candidatus Aenigmatarchaeota archaeon]
MKIKNIIVLPKSKFLRVLCLKCKNEQIVFSKVVALVKCLKCGEILAEPTGGVARIRGKVLEKLG